MDNSHITGNMRIENHVFISVFVSTTNDNTMEREAYCEDHVRGSVIEDYVTVGEAAIFCRVYVLVGTQLWAQVR